MAFAILVVVEIISDSGAENFFVAHWFDLIIDAAIAAFAAFAMPVLKRWIGPHHPRAEKAIRLWAFASTGSIAIIVIAITVKILL